MRKLLLVVPLVMLGAGSTACATKKFVRGEVGQVNTKVQGLSTQLEETQERTKKNEGAHRAKSTRRPMRPASRARPRSRSADAAKSDAAKADAHAAAVETANKKLIYEVVLNEDEGNFKFGKTMLPDEAKAKIDEMVSQLKADPKNVFIEIEGHTDNVGSKNYNETARPRARGSREALPLRGAPGAAAQDQRDQLRRGQAGVAEQHEGRPRAEPPRRHQGARVTRSDYRDEPSSRGLGLAVRRALSCEGSRPVGLNPASRPERPEQPASPPALQSTIRTRS